MKTFLLSAAVLVQFSAMAAPAFAGEAKVIVNVQTHDSRNQPYRKMQIDVFPKTNLMLGHPHADTGVDGLATVRFGNENYLPEEICAWIREGYYCANVKSVAITAQAHFRALSQIHPQAA